MKILGDRCGGQEFWRRIENSFVKILARFMVSEEGSSRESLLAVVSDMDIFVRVASGDVGPLWLWP
jgi:hypothetical protein